MEEESLPIGIKVYSLGGYAELDEKQILNEVHV
jgi:hypothetical protein